MGHVVSVSQRPNDFYLFRYGGSSEPILSFPQSYTWVDFKTGSSEKRIFHSTPLQECHRTKKLQYVPIRSTVLRGNNSENNQVTWWSRMRGVGGGIVRSFCTFVFILPNSAKHSFCHDQNMAPGEFVTEPAVSLISGVLLRWRPARSTRPGKELASSSAERETGSQDGPISLPW